MHISGISKVIDLALVEKLKDIFVQSYSKIGINSSELEKKTYVVLLFITIEFFILSSKLKELHLFLTDLPPRYEAIETIMRFCLHFEQSLRVESREVKLTFDFFSEDKKFYIGGNEAKDKEELITNLLFDAITLYSKEQSNEDYNQFNIKKAYDLLFICLRKMLENKSEVSKKMINANDHMFSTKIFLVAIKTYSSEPNVIDKIIKNDILPISYLALTFYEKPFIFQLLLELSKTKDYSDEEINLTLEIIGYLVDEKKFLKPSEMLKFLYFNIINILVFLFQLSEKRPNSKLFLNETFQELFLKKYIQFLKCNSILYTKIVLPVIEKESSSKKVKEHYKKAISEILFDFLTIVYLKTKVKAYYITLSKVFLIHVQINPSAAPKNPVCAEEKPAGTSESSGSSSRSSFDLSKIKEYHSLPFYIDTKNRISINKFYDSKKIKVIVKTLEGEMVNVNFIEYFLIKILLYMLSLDKTQFIELYDFFSYMFEVICGEYSLIKKQSNTILNKVYNPNATQLSLYNNIQKLLEKKHTNNDGEKSSRDFLKQFETLVLTDLKDEGKLQQYSFYLTISSCLIKGLLYTELQEKKKEEERKRRNSKKKSSFQGSMSQPVLNSQNTNQINEHKVLYKGSTDNIINVKDLDPLNNDAKPSSLISDSMTRTISSSDKISNPNMSNQSLTNVTSNTTNTLSDLYFFTITNLNTENVILSPRLFVMCNFSIQFREAFFRNELFEKLRLYYISHFPTSNPATKLLRYPSKIKNYSNTYEPPMFLKQDMNFFTNNYFNPSHLYFDSELLAGLKRINLQKRFLDVLDEKATTFSCELLVNEKAFSGTLGVFGNIIYFSNIINTPETSETLELLKENNNQLELLFSDLEENRVSESKQIVLFSSEINQIISRRFLFMWQAVEIYHKNGKSYFFNFYREAKLKEFYDTIKKISSNIKIIEDSVWFFNNQPFTQNWLDNKLSTYEYLLLVNKYASRTFKEEGQYLVFPWVTNEFKNIFDIDPDKILEEESDKKKTPELSSIRDFKYPISCQTQDKRDRVIDKYLDNNIFGTQDPDMKENIFRSHFRSHYSVSSFVVYFLMRIDPFCNGMIKLQGDKFDNPNRMLDNWEEAKNVLLQGNDNRELIPEMFSFTEAMINLNCNFFGRKNNGDLVDDARIYNSQENLEIKDIVKFFLHHRKILDSIYVSKKISLWIDNFFGVNQLSKDPNSCNIFQESSYSQNNNLEKELQKIIKANSQSPIGDKIKEIRNLKVRSIINFGQTPEQLFKSKLPQKKDFEYHQKPREKQKKLFFSLKKIEENTLTNIPLNLIYFKYEGNKMYILTKKREVFLYTFNRNDIFEQKEKLKLSDKKEIICPRFEFFEEYIPPDKMSSFYIHKPKYSMVLLNKGTVLVIGRTINQCLEMKILTGKSQTLTEQSVYVGTFITSMFKIDDTSFYTGGRDGKLIRWELKDNKIVQKKSVFAHLSSINTIYVKHRLNILLTSSSNESLVYIRKNYNFELLATIELPKNFLCVECRVSKLNLIYVLCFDYVMKKHCILGYTCNGIPFARSEHGFYNNISTTKNGDVIVGNYYEKTITILSGSDLSSARSRNFFEQNPLSGKKEQFYFEQFIYSKSNDIISLGCSNQIIKFIDLKEKENMEFFR